MKRLDFIDISRAIAIIFIVLGHTISHSYHCELLYKLVYSFHVALFFIISGYVFNVKTTSFKDLIKKSFIRLLIPYFIWSTLFLFPYYIFGNNISSDLGVNASFEIKEAILNILYGTGAGEALKQNSPLWFLPALFSMQLVYYWIIKFVNKYNNIVKYIIVVLLLIITIICNYFLKIVLPFGINTVLTMGIYFYVGYLLNITKHLNKIMNNLIIFIFITIIGIISALLNGYVNAIDYGYGNIFLSLLSGFCLSIVFICISIVIDHNKILCYIGRNTMPILIFHKIPIIIFQSKLGKISELLLNSNFIIELLISIFVLIISVIISLIIGYIIRKIFPIAIGNNKTITIKCSKL